LVEAAILEKAQNWLGVMLGYSATWPPFLARLDPKLIIEYDAPVKDGSKIRDYLSPVVVDWPRRWRELHGTAASEKLAELDSHPYNKPTSDFIEFSRVNEDWFTKPKNELKNARLRMRPVGEIEIGA
jgi:hypothetical protein